MDCSPPVSSVHGDSPSKNTGLGCHALLQGIFPTQGSSPHLLHCKWIFYCWTTEETLKSTEEEVFTWQKSVCSVSEPAPPPPKQLLNIYQYNTDLVVAKDNDDKSTLKPHMPRVFFAKYRQVSRLFCKCWLWRINLIHWNIFYSTTIKTHGVNYPGGPVIKNPSVNAGDAGSIPGLGSFHVSWGHSACVPQLLKPVHLEPMLCNKRSHHNEKPAHGN